MKEQQKWWCDEDPGTNIDFGEYPVCLTTDSGTTPEGFDNIDSLFDSLIDEKVIDKKHAEKMKFKYIENNFKP